MPTMFVRNVLPTRADEIAVVSEVLRQNSSVSSMLPGAEDRAWR